MVAWLYGEVGLQLFQRVDTCVNVSHHQPLLEYYDAVAYFGHVVEVVAGDEHGHVVFFLQVVQQSFQADLRRWIEITLLITFCGAIRP